MTKKYAFLILFSIICSKSQAQSKSAQYWFDKGEETKDYLLQVDYFTRAIEAGLNDSWVYYFRGYANAQVDRNQAAIRDYLLAEKATGNLEKSFIQSALAWSYLAVGKMDEGIESATKATVSKPGNSDAWNILGWLQMEKQNYPASADAFTHYLDLEEDKYYGYRSRSYAYLLGKDFTKALADCEAGLKVKPNDDHLLERKSLVLMKMGKTEEAMKIISSKITYKPDDPISISNLGNIFFENGDYRSAIEYHTEGIRLYEKKIKIDPTFITTYREDVYQIYLNRGEAHYMLKEYQIALADYTQSTRIKPEDHRAWYQIGELQTFQENYLEATRGYEKAFSIKPDMKDGWVNLGFCYDHINEKQKAIDAYTRGIKADPNVGLLWNNRGYSYLEMKIYDKAFADLSKAIEVEPEVIMSHVSLGEYYFFKGDFNAAIKKFDEAIAMPGGDVAEYSTAYYTRGMCYLKLKNFVQAEEDERSALRLNSDYIKAFEQLGIACFEQKKMCEAFKAFKQALSMDSNNTVRETKESAAYLGKLTTNPCD